MSEPLNELILDYKMECDRINTSRDTTIGKVCNIIRLSMDYAELLKFNSDISTNDIEVWGALFTRYMNKL